MRIMIRDKITYLTKSTMKVKNSREEWIVVENCHEPIISQELWDTVHKIMNAKHRTAKTDEVQMFVGLLYCAYCGHALNYPQKKRKDGRVFQQVEIYYRFIGKSEHAAESEKQCRIGVKALLLNESNVALYTAYGHRFKSCRRNHSES